MKSILSTLLLLGAVQAHAQNQLILDHPQTAGMSGFRAHWNQPIPVAENGTRLLKDKVVTDRGQTAVWNGQQPGPLAFDAEHRSLLVRFPDAAEKIAAAMASGKKIEKIELVLPYLDEEIWPQGGLDFPLADGYRYRMNWDCDNLYRKNRPNWHAQAYLLRKPWQSDAKTGPTYNAAVNGAVYWKRFGASDPNEDRFPAVLGPEEVSSYHPEGHLDVTAVLNDPAFGASMEARLRALADCGFVLSKQETYDARFFQGAYEYAISTGPRAILIKEPKLVVTFAPGQPTRLKLPPPANVPELAKLHSVKPLGAPSAVIPSPQEIAKLNERLMGKPAWMPDWQYERVRQLLGLKFGGAPKPFYYLALPEFAQKKVLGDGAREAKAQNQPFDGDYAVYLAWLDWINGRPLRYYEGHLTAANDAWAWYNFREAMPEPVKDMIVRNWTAWLMPDRETAPTDNQRKDYADTTGKLIHPMADDPRVGSNANGPAKWGQGDTYYRTTGDWRGNKSYYRSGFTRMISTANFNSSATSGALLNGQIIGSERAIEDGGAGLMIFPFWLWTYSAGVGQEFIDHYYWAIASAGNKLFADFCQKPQDRMAGWSIIQKTANDLAVAYHPNLKKLLGPASRTYYEHVLGEQDGLYHILHTMSQKGALSDMESGVLPALTSKETKNPLSAWGHDFPPESVALNTLSGRWGEPWFTEWVDEKPLPWFSLLEKKVVAEGDWVSTYFGENYGLSSIRFTPQRIHVLGHWRRKAEQPSTMRDIGTLDLRIGFNQTQLGNDLEGVISKQGFYRLYQHQNKLIMLARPNLSAITTQAGARKFGQKSLPAEEIKSVQCSAALFNYEQPKPTWEIYVGSNKISALPATAKFGEVITIHDGVSYLAIRPLPTDDLGRDTEIELAEGLPQTQAYHEQTNIQAALLINAYFCKRSTAISKDDLEKLKNAWSGFIVEMGDAKEYGSFANFQKQMLAAKPTGSPKDGVSYTSGNIALAAKWTPVMKEGTEKMDGAPAPMDFTVNGKDPYAYAQEQALCQDTTLSQMGKGRLEKAGAVVERDGPGQFLALQLFPKQKLAVATNPVPNYQTYRFRTGEGVQILPDGACSMGYWAVKDSANLEIRYQAFEGKYREELASAGKPEATVLFVSGVKAKPQVKLNDQDVSAKIKPWTQGPLTGWLVPLADKVPEDPELTARLAQTLKATTKQ